MSQKETFGLRLRAARERRSLSLEDISARTKVPVALWEAMERNDFARWPSGLFARAYVRDFARLTGLDPEEIVDEFCRHFPNGDRRRGTLVRAQAEAVNTVPRFEDDTVPAQGDRRADPGRPDEAVRPFWARVPIQRAIGVAGDLAVAATVAVGLAELTRSPWLPVVGLTSLAYTTIGTLCFGRSPGFMLAEWLALRVPQLLDVGERRLSTRAHVRPF